MEKSKEYSVRFYRNGRCFCKVSFDNAEEAEAFTVEDLGIEKRVIGPVINLLGEEWRDVEGREGKYMVSNNGRIKSLSFARTGRESVMVAMASPSGYSRVNLRQGLRLVHRLVWSAFNGPIPSGLWVNHKNRNPKDNRLDNLELATPRENQHHWMKMDWGSIGVSKHNEKWVARIYFDGVEINLGAYVLKEDAQIVFDEILDGINAIERIR